MKKSQKFMVWVKGVQIGIMKKAEMLGEPLLEVMAIFERDKKEKPSLIGVGLEWKGVLVQFQMV